MRRGATARFTTTSTSTISATFSAPSDLARIEQAEAVWLRGAHCVGFSSGWAAQRAVEHYALDPSRVHVVGNFGEIEVPADDEYAGTKAIRLRLDRFRRQGRPDGLGGISAVAAAPSGCHARHCRRRAADGGDEAGVTVDWLSYERSCRRSTRFRQILAGTRALVHPTNSDISPLIIIEAGFFGCPAIASRASPSPNLSITAHRASSRRCVGGRRCRRHELHARERDAIIATCDSVRATKALDEHSKAAFGNKMRALRRATAHAR